MFYGSERKNRVHGLRGNAEECGRHRRFLQNFDRGMKPDKGERGKSMQVVIEIPKEVLYDTKQTIEQATVVVKHFCNTYG